MIGHDQPIEGTYKLNGLAVVGDERYSVKLFNRYNVNSRLVGFTP